MRNLKKILALVLAMMMVLSMMVTANAAFVDADDITGKYNEAVEVLSGIGVIDGVKNADGTYSFNPQGTLTRAAAAKIVSYILEGSLTGIDAVADSVTNPFSDLPSWAEPYVLYAYNAGVVVGDGNGKYSPTRELTGYEFGKMLLIAAGICDNDDFAKDWKTVVASELKDNGLWNSKYFALSKKLTREEACYLAFNALNYGETVVITEDSYVVIGITPAFITATGSVNGKSYDNLTDALKAAQAIQVAGADTDTEDDDVYAVYNRDFAIEKGTVTYEKTDDSLATEIFALSYIKTYDALMQPVKLWKSGSSTVAVLYTDPVLTSTTAATGASLFAATGKGNVGVTQWTVATYNNGNSGSNATLKANDLATIFGGNGTITNLYKGWDNKFYIAYTTSKLVKVESIVPSTTSYGAEYATYTLVNVDGTSYGTFDLCTKPVLVADYYADEIDPNGAAKNDYVTVVVDSDGFATLYPVTLVTGALTGISVTTEPVYTIGGQTYQLAANGTAPATYNVPLTYAIDQFGYLQGAVTVETYGNYLYVVGAEKVSALVDGKIIDSVVASVMFTDGTAGEITVKKADTLEDSRLLTSPASVKGLYSYSIDKKGAYTLTSVANALAGNAELLYTNPTVATGKYANANTKFIYANFSLNEENKPEFNGTTTVVTGYKNITNVKIESGNAAAYIDHNNDGIVEYVFIVAPTSYAQTSMVYYTGAFATDGTDTVYTVMADGEVTTVTNVSGMSAGGRGMYIVTGTTGTKVVYGTDYDSTVKTFADKKIENKGGLLYVDSSLLGVVGDDVPVITMNEKTLATSIGTAADLATPVVQDLIIVYTPAIGGGYAIAAIYVMVN